MATENAEHAGGQYFSAAPAARSERRSVRLVLPDLSLELVTDRGVFAGERVDTGTKLLLSEVAVPSGLSGDVLDLGCGYGPIAITVARRAPAATLWALDVNERALGLVRENAGAAGVAERVRPVTPDQVPIEIRFEAIYTNPPIRIGKAALHDLLSTWLSRLTPEGRAWLVVHKHLGSDSLAVWLRSRGFAVDRLSSKLGYRLLAVAPQ